MKIRHLPQIQAHLRNTGFNFIVPTKIAQPHDVDSSIKCLKALKGSSHAARESKDIVCNADVSADADVDKSRVALGYALLNLDRNEANDKLLKQITKQICAKLELKTPEKNFLVYLWTHRGRCNII